MQRVQKKLLYHILSYPIELTHFIIICSKYTLFLCFWNPVTCPQKLLMYTFIMFYGFFIRFIFPGPISWVDKDLKFSRFTKLWIAIFCEKLALRWISFVYPQPLVRTTLQYRTILSWLKQSSSSKFGLSKSNSWNKQAKKHLLDEKEKIGTKNSRTLVLMQNIINR